MCHGGEIGGMRLVGMSCKHSLNAIAPVFDKSVTPVRVRRGAHCVDSLRQACEIAGVGVGCNADGMEPDNSVHEDVALDGPPRACSNAVQLSASMHSRAHNSRDMPGNEASTWLPLLMLRWRVHR